MKNPVAAMGVDVDFNNITYTIIDINGKLITMDTIPFRGLRIALHFKKLAEELQRRYPRSWRFIKWVRRIRARRLRRARSILNDSCRSTAKKIVEIAREHNAVMILEGLKKLKTSANGDACSTGSYSYGRMGGYRATSIIKALQEGIPAVFVVPRNTSRISLIGGELELINYKWARLPNGYIVTRDIIASWNLALKHLHMRSSRGRWSPDSPCDAGMKTRPKQGEPVQVPIVSKVLKV